ncbi:SLBB domain-containing protein [Thalassotalea aquiviva]|uniref:SLBB domain-containing protein n=1 Tax=Thalassotalea aquiviva TaxID=3242415 RepID=UPI00352B85EE
MSFKNVFLKCILLMVFISSTVAAAVPSAAQIEQFKRLPKAQQEALAKSMGIDLKSLNIGATTQPEVEELTPIVERPEQELLPFEFELEEDDELKPFGYDVFANAPTTFTPNLDVAVPNGYLVGPGDQVSVQIFGKENLEYTLPVTREGAVVVPNLGPFKVAGLTYAELKQFLKAKIEQRILGVNAVVSLSSLRSMRVFVLGDAYKPGPYILNSLASVTHALFAAGGISDIGSLRNIQVKRSGQLIKQVDLYDLLISGDSSNDVLLQAGDVVFVAPIGQRVSVDGEVRRPAIYEIKPGETFGQIMAMAGGALPSAFPKATRVERFGGNNLRSVINVDLNSPSDLKKMVKNGDLIFVNKTSELLEQSIEVIGAATRPGSYQWVPGQKIADVFPSFNAYLLEDADLNYSLIVREIDNARNIEILQFKLANAIKDPFSEDNITLKAQDKIIIFSNTETTLSLNKKTDDSQNHNQDGYVGKRNVKFEQQNSVEDEETKLLTELRNKSIEELTDGKDGEPTLVEELTDNARFKLLAPIIQKLKQQGASGKPMQLVEVDGQVKTPGIYPLARNASVSDLIAAAGGVTESAYLARAEITRNVIEQQKAGKLSINVNLENALNGITADNIKLLSKDRLNVHQIPAWTENHVITLKGEFVFPGKYTIRRGETLSDVIKKAGGFTEYAFVEGSVFTREKLKELEYENLKKLAADLRMEIASKTLTEGSDVAYAEAQQLLDDLTSIDAVGRLVVDLPKLVSDVNYDVLLENGDTLYVPTKNNSINVIGQVNVSTSHMFDDNLTVQDYITKSGGTKQRAEEDDIFVIAANGDIKVIEDANWFSDGDLDLKAGDTIVVPLDSDYTNNLTLWSAGTQIMYNLAVAIAAISGL